MLYNQTHKQLETLGTFPASEDLPQKSETIAKKLILDFFFFFFFLRQESLIAQANLKLGMQPRMTMNGPLVPIFKFWDYTCVLKLFLSVSSKLLRSSKHILEAVRSLRVWKDELPH